MHEQDGRRPFESSLSNGRMTDCEYTANAATVREHEVFTNLSAWLKEKQNGRMTDCEYT